MFLVNGNKQDFISTNDRSIHFGDGVFTTARIIDGHICLYNEHLQRLKNSCKRLMIPFNQWDILNTEMCTLADNISNGVLKVIISRGIGGRGYSIDNCNNPNRILSIVPYPHHYNNWRKSGIKLILSPIRLGRNPALAGIKHLNRLEQVLIRIHLSYSNANEAIVLDSEGIIIECCTANILWRKGDEVFTPCLDQAGVNGIMRQFCISKLAYSSFHITEVSTGIQSLYLADEVLICNTLMPIISVISYKDKIWKSDALYNFLAPFCE